MLTTFYLTQLEKTTSTCRVCHAKFSKLGKRQKVRNCRICGLALCKTCSNKELLVYFDDRLIEEERNAPKIAIIRLEGVGIEMSSSLRDFVTYYISFK